MSGHLVNESLIFTLLLPIATGNIWLLNEQNNELKDNVEQRGSAESADLIVSTYTYNLLIHCSYKNINHSSFKFSLEGHVLIISTKLTT